MTGQVPPKGAAGQWHARLPRARAQGPCKAQQPRARRASHTRRSEPGILLTLWSFQGGGCMSERQILNSSRDDRCRPASLRRPASSPPAAAPAASHKLAALSRLPAEPIRRCHGTKAAGRCSCSAAARGARRLVQPPVCGRVGPRALQAPPAPPSCLGRLLCSNWRPASGCNACGRGLFGTPAHTLASCRPLRPAPPAPAGRAPGDRRA